MMKTLKQMYCLLTNKERRQLVWLLGPMVLAAVVNVVGVAFVVPFIAVVANPNTVTMHPKLRWLYDTFHFQSMHIFLLALGAAVFLMLLLGNGLGALTTWLMLRFSNLCSCSISTRLFASYLLRPYAYFLGENSAALAKNVLVEVEAVCQQVMKHAIDMVARAVAMLLIIGLLFYVNPVLASLILVVLGGAYVVIYAVVRKRLAAISISHVQSKESRFKIVHEAFGGIKEVKLYNNEHLFVDDFSVPAHQFSTEEASSQSISLLPRYALEVIAFGGILLIVLFMLATHQSVTSMMPLLALYAFAGYRLMPGLQVIFGSITSIRAYKGALDILTEDLNLGDEVAVRESKYCFKAFNKIILNDVVFAYQNQSRPTLDHLNLVIKAGSQVGIVGETGAGKTTLIDILLGLLLPVSGELLIDNIPINMSNRMAWQRVMGYVPQSIYLGDMSIARNIAFGVEDSEIDWDRLKHVVVNAQLHEFIEGLPEGYHTRVGERGVCLSGGQRQRVGIARALYRQPSVLILDEATSALDNVTEHRITQFIASLPITTITIAHRLSTIQHCDTIYVLQKGGVQAQGSYGELLETNPFFQHLVTVTEPA